MDNHNKGNEEAVYKGLFFGILIGVGLVWFLNSESGKEILKRARRRIDEALTFEPGMENYEFEDGEVNPIEAQPKRKPSANPRRFFQKKAK